MKRLLLLLAILASAAVQAEGTTAHVSWVHPTQYSTIDPITGQAVANSPLPLSDIKQTIVKWFVGTALAGSVTVNGTGTTVDVPNLICGNYNFVAQTVVISDAKSPDSTPPTTYATGVSCKNPKAPTVAVS